MPLLKVAVAFHFPQGLPRKNLKVKVDKRFTSMFTDKRFQTAGGCLGMHEGVGC